MNKVDVMLQLQVDTFFFDIAKAATQWLSDISGDRGKMEQIEDMLLI